MPGGCFVDLDKCVCVVHISDESLKFVSFLFPGI